MVGVSAASCAASAQTKLERASTILTNMQNVRKPRCRTWPATTGAVRTPITRNWQLPAGLTLAWLRCLRVLAEPWSRGAANILAQPRSDNWLDSFEEQPSGVQHPHVYTGTHTRALGWACWAFESGFNNQVTWTPLAAIWLAWPRMLKFCRTRGVNGVCKSVNRISNVLVHDHNFLVGLNKGAAL